MKDIIDSVQAKLEPLNGLNYVDEDWGQLDYYSPNFPVQWPCVLIDTPSINFDNIGKDRSATPINRQMAEGLVSLKIANLKLTNTSGRAPKLQKENARSILELIEDIHKVIQGFCPTGNTGQLIRTAQRRQKRDDGVQEYTVLYRFERTNV